MIRSRCIALALSAVLASAAHAQDAPPAPPAPPVEPETKTKTKAPSCEGLAFLAGDWAGPLGEGELRAYYSSPQGGRVLSYSELRQGGKVVFHEFERFELLDGALRLTPCPGGRPAAVFALDALDPAQRRAVFVNPQNEFPQRIEYSSPAPDRLVITISNPGGKQEVFDLRRVGRPAPGVRPGTWRQRFTKKGVGALQTLPFPEGLIERLLVDLEQRGVQLSEFVLARALRGADAGISVGFNHLIQRREGRRVVDRLPAAPPGTHGFVKVGDELEIKVLGHEAKPVEGGYDYDVLLGMTLAGRTYEVRLRVAVRSSAEGIDVSSSFAATWEGPLPPSAGPAQQPPPQEPQPKEKEPKEKEPKEKEPKEKEPKEKEPAPAPEAPR
ncbi:MAG: DUF6265 family protein [Planctomycetota bacterium]